MSGADPEAIKAAFKIFDANGDGTITKEELLAILTRQTSSRQPPLTIEDAEALFRSVDLDCNGRVDYDEFATAWGNKTITLEAPVPTRFVRLAALQRHGSLPRFGSTRAFAHPITGEPNANLCEPREAFDASTTCFVFVSHRWARPGAGARGHPDDDQQSKFKLIMAAMHLLSGRHNTLVPEGIEMAIWLDYCCIDQDGAPSSELDNLGNLMAACDAIFTPVIDLDHASWSMSASSDIFSDYKAAGWQEYWSRGWCRVEAMLAAVKPVAAGRGDIFRGAMATALGEGRRPHVLYGTKDMEGNSLLHFLPPLLHATFEKYAPEHGELTKESDRAAVRRLTAEARVDVKPLAVGWVGAYQGRGSGEGKITGEDGSVFEGQFKDGVPHGKGKRTFITGHVFVGNHNMGKMHGHGRVMLADGSVIEGEYYNEKMLRGKMVMSRGDEYEGEIDEGVFHGHGKYRNVSGDTYEGSYEKGQQHGHGRWVGAQGETYVGAWARGLFEGAGKFRGADGTVLEGSTFCKGTLEGRGKWARDGATYEGEFRGNTFNGKGRFVGADGTVLEGSTFCKGALEGRGKWARDGATYEGEFRRSTFNGQGRFVGADGTVLEGPFSEGMVNGRGKWARDGARYEGEFVGGVFNGTGKFTTKEGHVMEGVWKDGQLKK